MNKISITSFAQWERIVNIFGSHDTPLKLRARVQNHSNSKVKIANACISVKRPILFFNTSKEMLHKNRSWTIDPKGYLDIEFDINAIARNYGINRKFRVKLYHDNTTTEGVLLTVDHLHSLVV